MSPYVIIGNGIAAAGCVEGVRSVDPSGKIVVISAESHPVYCRPLISYYLEGRTDLQRMPYRDADFYARNGCEVLYGREAVRIDPAAKTVLLDDGTAIPYSNLLNATGSSPFVPPFAGLDTVEKKYSFMTLDDALALEKALTPDARVLIVGAGLIGLKCAEGIRKRVASIAVCDLAERVLSSILDAECAPIVQRHLEANGIEFMLGDSVERFDGQSARMKSGRTVEFDILVLAVGVRANTRLVREIGGEIGRGIVIDDHMRTSVEGVYAAGDCAEGMDVSFGARRVLALLPNAYMQGHCAGANMAGGDAAFDNAIPMNAIGFFGMHIMTAGTYVAPAQGGTVYADAGEGGMRKLFTCGGLLTGFILIDQTARAGIYTSLIRNRTPLSEIDFDKLRASATSFAFSPEIRRKMFGGVV